MHLDSSNFPPIYIKYSVYILKFWQIYDMLYETKEVIIYIKKIYVAFALHHVAA
jgi:hypothetical protein